MLSPYTFTAPSSARIILATFDRYQGVSDARFTSLNCSFGVGDATANVQANRSLIKEHLHVDRLISARQVHGDQVFRVEGIPERDEEIDGVDALMTDKRGVGLMIQHADCQAVLLHDPVRSVIAAVHCGWQGSVIGILKKTIQQMRSCYDSQPQDITAAISPSLGPCCAEFVNHRQELPATFLAFQTRDNYFDFWQISKAQLMEAGLLPGNIKIAAICTSCTPDYFSYRRARRRGDGITGRNGSIIALA